jgi:hypothetical protein
MARPQVVYCYPEQVKPQVLEFLGAQAIDLQLAPTPGSAGLYRLLRRLWAQASDFLLVEHDVLPYPGALEEIWNCPQWLCAKPYQVGELWLGALGCTKVSGELMRAYPQAVEEAGKRPYPADSGIGYQDWEMLDCRLFAALADAGYAGALGAGYPHQHFPPVSHLHPYPGAGTIRRLEAPSPPQAPLSALQVGAAWQLSFKFGRPLTQDGQPAHRLLPASCFWLLGGEEAEASFFIPEQRGATLGVAFCQLLGQPRPRLRAGFRSADGQFGLSAPLSLARP